MQQFPQCIGNMANLIELSFGNTLVVGEVPVSLCQLKKLQTLHLFLTEIGGQIPQCISDMTALAGMQHLYISLKLFQTDVFFAFNTMNGTVPVSICENSNLEQLYVLGTEIEGEIPQCIGDLSKLVCF